MTLQLECVKLNNYILLELDERVNKYGWKDLELEGIAYVEKCVAEFKVGEKIKTPWGKFEVKISERQNGKYIDIPICFSKMTLGVHTRE